MSVDIKNLERIFETDVQFYLKDQLTDLCRSSNEEQCGFVGDRWNIYVIKNTHSDPQSNFLIDEKQGMLALREMAYKKEKPIAVFHTHPGKSPCWPSLDDAEGFPPSNANLRYLIATGTTLAEWRRKQ